MQKDRTVAVCVDYQEKLLPAMMNTDALLDHSVRLLEGLKALALPIYLTQQYTQGLGMTTECIQTAAGTAEYIEKLTFSAYPQLAALLPPPEEKPFVLICGIESHICVLQTAIDLKQHGYQPYLVTNCISSRKPEDYETALKRAVQEGILLTTYEAALFELLEIAGTTESKTVQKIIR